MGIQGTVTATGIIDGVQLVNFESDAINAISRMDVVSAILAAGGKVTGFGKRGHGSYFQAEIKAELLPAGWVMRVSALAHRDCRELS